MFTIPVEDAVFAVCMLVGGGLLLVTVLVDDVLGGILDSLNIGFDIGGVSLMPLALGFISMFGAGGLFATQVLDLHAGQAALIAAISGAVGFSLVFGLFSLFRRAEGEAPFQLEDLVGTSAAVAVSIPAGRLGSVYVRTAGMTHEISATASEDIPSGSAVTVTGVAGNQLIVRPAVAPATEGGPQRA